MTNADAIPTTYEAFAAHYRDTFRRMMKYSPKEAGSMILCERLARLSDAQPEWAERVEAEAEANKD